jgi:hypothetical protein
MADLVEYAFGGENTTWGKKRIDHGHPTPYSLKYIELGNEQYNPDWASQVTAMQQRATQLGQADRLVYFWPKGACAKATPHEPISLVSQRTTDCRLIIRAFIVIPYNSYLFVIYLSRRLVNSWLGAYMYSSLFTHQSSNMF